MKTKHAAQRTPGPYRARPIPGGRDGRYNYWIDGGEHSKPLADVRDHGDESVATAAFIVRACNSHDALVAALEAAELSCTQARLANGVGKKTQAEQIRFLLASFELLATEARAALAHPEQQTDNGGHNESR